MQISQGCAVKIATYRTDSTYQYIYRQMLIVFIIKNTLYANPLYRPFLPVFPFLFTGIVYTGGGAMF